MVRRTILPSVAGFVGAIPNAGDTKDKGGQKGSQKGRKDKPRFRKYNNVDQNEEESDDPEVYDEWSMMTIYYDAVKVHPDTMLFDDIDGLERCECYKNDLIISIPESSLLSSSEFHTSSNDKSMGDQINGLERTSVLYNHCIRAPERSETDVLTSSDKSMKGFTIDPENREALYFDKVTNVDSWQRCIITKLETHYR